MDNVLVLKGVRGDDVELWMWMDADFAGDARTRKSTTGWVMKLVGREGTSCFLESKTITQGSLSLSTAEAELVAIRDALKALLARLGTLEALFPSVKVRMFSDSQAALQIVEKGVSKALRHARKLHDLSVKWVSAVIGQFGFWLGKVASPDNHSDPNTKALSVEDHEYHHRFGYGAVERGTRGEWHACSGRCPRD